MKKLLFVCLGNICRSPMAEGAMKDIIEKKDKKNNFFIDSAGTSAYHIGEFADERMRETALFHEIRLTSKARQVVVDDFYEYDYIIAMDQANLKDLKKIAPQEGTAQLVLMRDYDLEATFKDVPDPYYGGLDGFEEVFQIVYRSCKQFYNEELS